MGEALERVVRLATISVRAHRRWDPYNLEFIDIDAYTWESMFNVGDTVEDIRFGRQGRTRGHILEVLTPDPRHIPPKMEPMYHVRWDNRHETFEYESALGIVWPKKKWGAQSPATMGIRWGWSREDEPQSSVVRLADLMGEKWSMFDEEFDIEAPDVD